MTINLAILERSAVTRLSMQHSLTNANWPQSLLREWLSEAYRIMQRRLMLVRSTHQANLTAGTSTYSRPSDLLDDLILDFYIKTTDGSGYKLDRRTLAYMRDNYGLFSSTDYSSPQDWCFKDGSILIQPTPENSVTNGIELDYVPDPSDLSRLTHGVLTAAVSNGSATVTFSDTITGLIEAGDDFGVRSGASVLPDTWYRVSSVDNATTVTLASAYAETDDATTLFTVAQVPLIESRRPGLTHGAAVDYVLYRAQEMENGLEAAGAELARWEGRLAEIGDLHAEEYGTVIRKKNAWKHHPALRW